MDLVTHLRHVVAPHAQRFVDGHFGNDAPRPQVSIPANPSEDSDLIVTKGIKDAADEIERLSLALREIGVRGTLITGGDCGVLRDHARRALGLEPLDT